MPTPESGGATISGSQHCGRIQGPCFEGLLATRCKRVAPAGQTHSTAAKRSAGESPIAGLSESEPPEEERSDDPDADEDPANGPSAAESASSSAKAGAGATPGGSAS